MPKPDEDQDVTAEPGFLGFELTFDPEQGKAFAGDMKIFDEADPHKHKKPDWCRLEDEELN